MDTLRDEFENPKADFDELKHQLEEFSVLCADQIEELDESSKQELGSRWLEILDRLAELLTRAEQVDEGLSSFENTLNYYDPYSQEFDI